jgi:hypothetical protein
MVMITDIIKVFVTNIFFSFIYIYIYIYICILIHTYLLSIYTFVLHDLTTNTFNAENNLL